MNAAKVPGASPALLHPAGTWRRHDGIMGVWWQEFWAPRPEIPGLPMWRAVAMRGWGYFPGLHLVGWRWALIGEPPTPRSDDLQWRRAWTLRGAQRQAEAAVMDADGREA